VIELELRPGRVIAGEPADLRLRVTNTGSGPCTNVAFTIEVPAGIIHVLGRDNVYFEQLEARESSELELRVIAERPGRFGFTTRDFSYRDHRGQARAVPEFDLELVAVAAGPPPPQPRVRIEVQTEHLPLDEWSELRATLSNTGAVGVTDLVVAISGPFTPDARSRSRRIGALAPGASAAVRFPVRADEAGAAVPIHLDLRYSGPAGPAELSAKATIGVARAGGPRPDARKAPKLTILVLSANPLGTGRLRLDEEFRRIEQAIREGRNRDSVQVRLCPAVRGEDIVQWLLEVKPEFLHLSGHGADGAFVAEDDHGFETILAPEPLGRLMSATGKGVRCVIVNACSTERLAREIANHVPHVIAMRHEVLDYVAIQFSIAFYRAIVAGLAIEDAFVVGQAAMGLANATELDTATLLSNPNLHVPED
jgi:hypothetical protein